MARRIERINSVIRQEISDLLLREIKDPRLDNFVSIVRVETAPDLSYARVYVSCMGSDEIKAETLAALHSASRFIKGELMKRIRIRTIPEIDFKQDDSIERGARVLELIEKIEQEESL